jgi:ubiquinone biosynthesis protein
MFNWNSALDETAISAVLSDEYARFAQPIREGLIRFLEGLPAAYQDEILQRQAALPASAGISERLALLARSCPVLHKLGQTLARDQRLAPELRQHLRELESFAPTVDDETIRGILSRELGPLEQRGVRLELPAIAEASVAVVVPFAQGGNGRGVGVNGHGKSQTGVFKILKPGIEERLDLELDLLTQVGAYLDERCHTLGIPHLDYEESFEQLREKLQSEVRLNEEQQHLTAAAAFYANEPRVHIPSLFPHCTPRVTSMERIYGQKITDHQPNTSIDARRLSDLVVRSLVGQAFFSRAKRAMFHCDPHAGNLFLTPENRLGILDWSLVGWLTERVQLAIVRIVQAAVSLNPQEILRLLLGLAEHRAPDQKVLATVIDNRLEVIRRGQLPGFQWLVKLLDDAAQTARLRLSTDMMLFRKALHTLEGVVAELGADELQMDRVLFVQFLSHFAAEWPRRWVAPPTSHDFATHVSNIDLARIWLSYPAVATRFWLGKSVGLLDAYCGAGKLHASAAGGAKIN